MSYFNNINDLTELRRLYYKLALKYHPDRGGDEEIMKLINNEYEEYSKKLINSNTEFSTSRKVYETQVSEELQNKINELFDLDLENLKIEIIGGWIWITGNTFAFKSEIKELAFKFSRNKTAWYWHASNYKKRSKKEFTMDGIRDLWGSQEVENDTKKQAVLN
jgi:hypothetical protein